MAVSARRVWAQAAGSCVAVGFGAADGVGCGASDGLGTGSRLVGGHTAKFGGTTAICSPETERTTRLFDAPTYNRGVEIGTPWDRPDWLIVALTINLYQQHLPFTVILHNPMEVSNILGLNTIVAHTKLNEESVLLQELVRALEALTQSGNADGWDVG